MESTSKSSLNDAIGELMQLDTFEKIFHPGENPDLVLSNIRGEVRIRGNHTNIISVRIEKLVETGDSAHTEIEISQGPEGRVTLHTQYEPGLRIFRKNIPCKVNYVVEVPESCRLHVHGVSNSTWIDRVKGGIDISTVSGDLELHSLSGSLTIRTVSGDVNAEQIQAATRVNSVSGDIHLHNSLLPSVNCKSVSGDMIFETPLGQGPYIFNTVSGDIQLVLKSTSGFSITSSSLSGEVRTPLLVTASNHSRKLHRLQILDGGVEIQHKSVSGDLVLVGEEMAEVRKEREYQDVSRAGIQSNKEILESLERGEIGVEDAVQKIGSQIHL
jgi:hypothetical protein